MSDTEVLDKESASEAVAVNGAKRGRGRPKKGQQKKSITNNGVSQNNGTNGLETEASILPKKRGRRPKADKPNKELKTSATIGAGDSKRGRGRPKKSQIKGKPKKRGRKPAKKSAGSDGSGEDEADPIDDNTGDEEDDPLEDPEDED